MGYVSKIITSTKFPENKYIALIAGKNQTKITKKKVSGNYVVRGIELSDMSVTYPYGIWSTYLLIHFFWHFRNETRLAAARNRSFSIPTPSLPSSIAVVKSFWASCKSLTFFLKSKKSLLFLIDFFFTTSVAGWMREIQELHQII